MTQPLSPSRLNNTAYQPPLWEIPEHIRMEQDGTQVLGRPQPVSRKMRKYPLWILSPSLSLLLPSYSDKPALQPLDRDADL